jgi:LysM repeat protein
MAARSPARFLAPIALVAVAFALYTVVNDARDKTGGGDSSSGSPAQTTPAANGGKKKGSAKKQAKRKRKTYVVKSGDTPSGIAAKTGVALTTLQKLNPDLDPQALTVGQRLKLRK